MGDEHEEEMPDYFGDYPDGSYWTTRRPDVDASVGRSRRHRKAAEPRTSENPYPLRMFAECCCSFALWGEVDEEPPTTSGLPDAGTLEEQLPISVSLRERLLAWASDHERYDGGDRTVPMEDFDERGFLMSRELQRELGNLYSVRYSFTFAETDRETLFRSVADEPLPGWTCH